MTYRLASLFTAAFLSTAAIAQEFDIDPTAAAVEDATAGDFDPNSPGFDPNAMTHHATETPVAPAIVIKKEVPPAPAVIIKKEAPPAPAPVAAKPAPQPPRDIPLIETQNASAAARGDVTYVTGGIGDDEREAIEASKGDYNLHVTSAAVSGAFVGDARVVITRKVNGLSEEMLNTVAGPLLYVRLPAGTYTLDATLGDQKKHQTFAVTRKGGAAKVSLGWKVAATSAQ